MNINLHDPDFLNGLLKSLDDMHHIKSEDIPNIELYMDQVTTFMNTHLDNCKRYPEDKILTKTMINNYAKNNLLPSPEKKKYSREHIFMLIFIYYYKGLLSISDIQKLFDTIVQEHFGKDSSLSLEDIYNEVFSMEQVQMDLLKKDVQQKLNSAKQLFTEETDNRDYLQMFSFICALSFDVYLKKQLIEHLIDHFDKPLSEKELKKAAKQKGKEQKES